MHYSSYVVMKIVLSQNQIPSSIQVVRNIGYIWVLPATLFMSKDYIVFSDPASTLLYSRIVDFALT